MDKERRLKLIEIYKKCSDDDLDQMIQEGRESYEDGAYELILEEIRRRGISDPASDDLLDDESDYDGESEYEYAEEINFEGMSSEDLMGMLVNIHTLDELNFHLAAAEAIRRNIDASDIRAYKKIVQCDNQCSANTDTVEMAIIENPRPLIILNSIEEADFYADALAEEGIPFEIQIIVDDRDYKKAELATNNIMLPPEE